MANPTLALVPTGVKAGKVYSVLPEDGTGDFTFTRASSATRVNEQGLIENVLTGVPRLDYTDGGCPALLLEPQRTNLYLNSEPTSNEGSANITYESFNWDLGFSNCTKFGDNSFSQYRYGASVVSGSQYTLSAFIIMDDFSEPLVGNDSTTGDFSFICGGDFTDVANDNIYQGGNIYRVSATAIAGTSLGHNGIIKYTSQSPKGFRVVGWQIETGSYATSYIPTTGSIFTRVTEACNGAGDVNTFNSEEGVLFVEMAALVDDLSSRFISVSNGTSTNYVTLYYSILSNRIKTTCYDGTNVINFITEDFIITDYLKIALKWKNNNFSLWVNSVEVGTSTANWIMPENTLDRLNLSHYNEGIPLFAKVKQLQVFKTALSDLELQALTT